MSEAGSIAAGLALLEAESRSSESEGDVLELGAPLKQARGVTTPGKTSSELASMSVELRQFYTPLIATGDADDIRGLASAFSKLSMFAL